MYELVRGIDSSLPAIEATPFTGAVPVADPAQDGEDGARFVYAAKKKSSQYQYTIGDSLIGGPNNQPVPVPVPINLALPGAPSTRNGVASVRSGTAAGSTGMSVTAGFTAGTATGTSAAVSGRGGVLLAGVVPSTAQSARRMSARPPISDVASASAESTTTASAGATAGPTDITSSPGGEAEPNNTAPLTSMLGKLAKFVGITDVAVFEPSSGSIETHLLESRAEFTSLSALHSLLIPPTQQGLLRTHFDEWFPELKAPLREWLRQLVVHVLKRRQLLNKLARDKKEAAM